MKVTLPKALLLAVLACSASYAATMRPEMIEAVGAGESREATAEFMQHVQKSGDVANIGAITKDGAGKLTVSQNYNVQTSLHVREGEVYIGGQENHVTIQCQPYLSNSPAINVGGNNASLVLDNATYKYYVFDPSAKGNSYVNAFVVGNVDGAGALVLKNGSLMTTTQSLFSYKNACMDHVMGSYASTEGNAIYVAPAERGSSRIEVLSGSKFQAGLSFFLTDVDITVDGGSTFEDGVRNIDNLTQTGGAYQGWLADDDGSGRTDIVANVTISDGSTWTSRADLNTSAAQTSVTNILVDSNSTLNSLRNTKFGYANANGTTNLTVQGASTANIWDVQVGNATGTETVNIKIADAESSMNAGTVVVHKGGSIDNSGTINLADREKIMKWRDDSIVGLTTKEEAVVHKAEAGVQVGGELINSGFIHTEDQEALLTVIAGGAVTNSGTIDVDTEIAGGTLTLDGGKMADITLTEGTIYVNGNTAAGALDLQAGTLVFNFAATAANEGIMLLEVADSGAAAMLQTESLTLGNNLKIVVEMTQEELADLDGKEFSLFSVAGQEEKLEETEILFTDGTTTKTGTIEVNGGAIKVTNSQTIPEPATATLSLLALAGLVARRRRAARR